MRQSASKLRAAVSLNQTLKREKYKDGNKERNTQRYKRKDKEMEQERIRTTIKLLFLFFPLNITISAVLLLYCVHSPAMLYCYFLVLLICSNLIYNGGCSSLPPCFTAYYIVHEPQSLKKLLTSQIWSTLHITLQDLIKLVLNVNNFIHHWPQMIALE